jgi:hypothetical protein
MAAAIRLRGLLLLALVVAAGLGKQSDAAGPLRLTEDGWYTWQIESVEHGIDERIYVEIRSGRVNNIDVVGEWCNGHWTSKHWRSQSARHEQARDIGPVSTDESIDWLEQYVGTKSNLASDALAAISRHAGDRSLKFLVDIVKSNAHYDLREEAIFWMAMSDSDAAFDYLNRWLMAE